MAGAEPVEVFVKGHIEDPVQAVFDVPVRPDGAGKQCGLQRGFDFGMQLRPVLLYREPVAGVLVEDLLGDPGLCPIASMVTSAPQIASLSGSSGRAVISLDVAARACWPGTRRWPLAQAETRSGGWRSCARSWLRREVLPSLALTMSLSVSWPGMRWANGRQRRRKSPGCDSIRRYGQMADFGECVDLRMQRPTTVPLRTLRAANKGGVPCRGEGRIVGFLEGSDAVRLQAMGADDGADGLCHAHRLAQIRPTVKLPSGSRHDSQLLDCARAGLAAIGASAGSTT